MKKMKKGTVQFIVLILIILEYIYIPSGTLYMIPSQLS
ncbi:putative membrane protein [Bacteroides fragilis str. 3783N1-6]|uniref:Membrane protein n=1 Tax=Bacteroides fragilis str. 3783N1-6 TaxID=1339310 RepID=A0AB73ALE0_BACFG|nr:putative membrane protein [Bacteroides fragilis str. 3783N2-1]EXY55816.1 putative membrane protein [Bacteroides fragilis str. 3976T7]EYB09927.1 putative membrane protein [Bacteroides fragilis str. 3783N1-6]